jgi:hypothetical protein
MRFRPFFHWLDLSRIIPCIFLLIPLLTKYKGGAAIYVTFFNNSLINLKKNVNIKELNMTTIDIGITHNDYFMVTQQKYSMLYYLLLYPCNPSAVNISNLFVFKTLWCIAFSTFKILHAMVKLLENCDHDLVLPFLQPNLPRQDIPHICRSCSEQSDNFPGNPPPPITVCVVPFHVLLAA